MSLEPTSERMIEEYRTASPQSYLIYLFHIVTYDYVRDLIAGKTVLDFGCGSGYGTARIAEPLPSASAALISVCPRSSGVPARSLAKSLPLRP